MANVYFNQLKWSNLGKFLAGEKPLALSQSGTSLRLVIEFGSATKNVLAIQIDHNQSPQARRVADKIAQGAALGMRCNIKRKP
jgi:hypothetical protein